MFQKLASHNDDIRRLIEKGYAVGFDSNYLIVRDIPYLDSERCLQWGAFVTKLEFIDEVRVKQHDHQVFFAGSHPHNIDGSSIANLGGGPTCLSLSDGAADIVVQRQFSNKPWSNGSWASFADFFEKIESYVTVISAPAMELHGASPLTFREVEPGAGQSVFKISDTLTSRAEIVELSAKFADEVIAVIGLGGTGAYVLDFLVKTPVKEIRGFDRDDFHVHNAFRSPGRLDPDRELGQKKADVYQGRFSAFRHGLSLHARFIDATSDEDLSGVTFAFVCVDKGSSRKGIFDLLVRKKIPFIDVGMGLKRRNGVLNGMIRTVHYPTDLAEAVLDKGLSELSDPAENIYRTNIQIGELNALNAALAVIRYKQVKGFYYEDAPVCGILFELADLKSVTMSFVDEA